MNARVLVRGDVPRNFKAFFVSLHVWFFVVVVVVGGVGVGVGVVCSCVFLFFVFSCTFLYLPITLFFRVNPNVLRLSPVFVGENSSNCQGMMRALNQEQKDEVEKNEACNKAGSPRSVGYGNLNVHSRTNTVRT